MTAFPKPRPSKLERADRRKARRSKDEAENKKVRARSGGQCEVHEAKTLRWIEAKAFALEVERCPRRGNQTHHMIGGWGKRARGISVLAEHKQYVCQACHDDIGGHVLKRIGGIPPLWTDCYERVT